MDEKELLEVPRSKLSQLLKATANPAGCIMPEKDRSYLEGWQHALMALQGKLIKNSYYQNKNHSLIQRFLYKIPLKPV